MNKAFKTKLVLHQQQVCNDVVLNSCLATSEGTLEKISFYLTLNKKNHIVELEAPLELSG